MILTTKADTMNTAVYEKSDSNMTIYQKEWYLIFDEIYSRRNRNDKYSNSFNNYKFFILTRKSDKNMFLVAEQQGENPFLCTSIKISIGFAS